MDSNKIKKGLGRGLSSLIGDTKIDIQKNHDEESKSKKRLLFFLIFHNYNLLKL